MSIGLVCQYLEPKVKRSGDIEYKNISGERSLQYKQYLKNLYSKEYIEEIWGKIKPLSHLSNSKPDMLDGSFSEKRKHSDYVYNIPEYQKLLNNENKIDIDFEFKMKNFAIKKAIKDFEILL